MKIYSNEYITDFNKLKNAVIGFEFEFYTDKSYFKLLELLNNELAPIQSRGFRKYHSDFVPDENNFKLEPDLSGGPELCEYITGPIPYVNSKIILLKILKVLDKYARTDEKCSIHINISFEDIGNGKVLDNLNKLKLILCGFHEAALMSHSVYKYINPGIKYTMKYTTVQGVNEF